MLEQKKRKISSVKHAGSKADPIRENIEASKHRNIETSKHRVELLVAINRVVRFDHTLFFLNGKRAGFPLVFREYGTGRCCSARRIFRSTVIFTRVVAPQWILLFPRLLTISKPSRHRGFDPPTPSTPPILDSRLALRLSLF